MQALSWASHTRQVRSWETESNQWTFGNASIELNFLPFYGRFKAWQKDKKSIGLTELKTKEGYSLKLMVAHN